MNISTSRFARSKLYLALTAALALGGCGGTGQDDGSVSTNQTTFSGLAIDGNLARATVFLDQNNNGTRDPWESYAFTDNDGYYSYNPLTNTNYCRNDAPASEKIYCLVSRRDLTNVVVRIDGGYDILTGEPFVGQLSRRVDVPNTTDTVDSVVSPLTTIVTNVESSTERSRVLNAIGVTDSDLDVDYLHSGNNNTEINTHLLNTALKIHKTVTLISDRLEDNYEEIQDESGVPNDPSANVYKYLAQEILTTDNSLDNVLRNNSALTRVMDQAEERIRETYQARELTLPTDLGNANVPDQMARVVNVASRIPDVVNRLIDPSALSFTNDEAVGSARALESLVIKTINEGPSSDDSIDNAVNFFLGDSTSDLVDSLTQALASNTADLSTLSGNDFSGSDFDSTDEIQGAATLPVDAQAFSQIGGMQLKVSDLDLGSAPNNLSDQEVEIYFDGSPSDISGSFLGCMKYIDGANSDGTLGEGNSRGELISGYWSMLGAVNGTDEAYSLLLTLEFLGATYQAIMKPAGNETIDGVNYEKIRFDNDGSFRVYHSEDGITETMNIPKTNSECQERLPSRVGI